VLISPEGGRGAVRPVVLLCRGASERLALVAIPRFADDVNPGPQAPAPRMRTTSTPRLSLNPWMG